MVVLYGCREQLAAALRQWHLSLTGAPPDRLYVAEECVPCSALGQWFIEHSPVSLQLLPAEDHPTRNLTRITYESADGTYTEQEIIALARGLEHIHFGWAMVGVTLRLPVLRWLAQLVTDAVGGGPREIQRNVRTIEFDTFRSGHLASHAAIPIKDPGFKPRS